MAINTNNSTNEYKGEETKDSLASDAYLKIQEATTQAINTLSVKYLDVIDHLFE